MSSLTHSSWRFAAQLDEPVVVSSIPAQVFSQRSAAWYMFVKPFPRVLLEPAGNVVAYLND